MGAMSRSSSFFTTAYLLLLISLGYLATDIYLPSLPFLADFFHTTDSQSQATLFFYLLSFSLSPLVFGPLSDVVGRKPVILGGVFIAFAATAGALFSSSIEQFFVFRFMQGLGLGAVMIASRSVPADLFLGRALAQQLNLITMCMPLVLAVAPLLGGILQEWFGWQAVFLFLSGYLAAVLLFVLWIPESLSHKHTYRAHQIFGFYQDHLKNWPFLQMGLNAVLPSFGLFAYMTVSPFLFQERLGLSPATFGSLSLGVGATIMFSGYCNSLLLHRFSQKTLVGLGFGLVFLSGTLLAIAEWIGAINPWTLALSSFLYFTCLPFCLSNAVALSLGYIKSHFGAAAALLTTAQFLIGCISTSLFADLPDFSVYPLSASFLAIGLLGLGNLLLWKKNVHQMQHQETKAQKH